MSCMKATYCLLAHLYQLKANLVVSFSLRILHISMNWFFLVAINVWHIYFHPQSSPNY